ncbi:hypothetical protein [Microbacterium sp. ZW T5_56]|uniref:hypothetical protein n=1 Tax=Microbacterium sp. ZW T5_56 TaxID=3378081 RepID=UPI0038533971
MATCEWTVRDGRAELAMTALRARALAMQTILGIALGLAFAAAIVAFVIVDARGGVIGPQPLLLLGGSVFLVIAGLVIVFARPFRRPGVLSISSGSIRWTDSRGDILVPLARVRTIAVRRRFIPGIDVETAAETWGLRTSASVLDDARDDMRPLSARARRYLDEAGFAPHPRGQVTVWRRDGTADDPTVTARA